MTADLLNSAVKGSRVELDFPAVDLPTLDPFTLGQRICRELAPELICHDPALLLKVIGLSGSLTTGAIHLGPLSITIFSDFLKGRIGLLFFAHALQIIARSTGLPV